MWKSLCRDTPLFTWDSIPLCHEHHTGGKQSAHLNARYDLMYKKMAQKAFEEKIGTREEFIKAFGKQWL